MKRTILFLLSAFFLLVPLLTNAQVSQYAFSSEYGYYTPIYGGTVHGTPTNDDTSFPNVPIGFTFNWLGTDYDAISIQTNGWICMGTTIGSSYTGISQTTYNNVVAALSMDLQGSTTGELMSLLEGVAPDRVFTVQWQNYKCYGTTGEGDIFNFQIKLYESTNAIEIVYGAFTKNSTNRTPQVGIRGITNTDFNNRMVTEGTNFWSTSEPGILNTSTCALTTATFPDNGLVYRYALVDQEYVGGEVFQNSTAVVLGSTDQDIIQIRVETYGSLTPLNLSQFVLNTSGTTEADDIINAKIYYTGNSPNFEAINQFGLTVNAPDGEFIINGEQTLLGGYNYFWLCYDVSNTATLGNFLDAACNSYTIDGTLEVPENTSPEGAREIKGPFNGIVTIGYDGDYPDLNAFASDLSVLGLSGNTTLQIISDLYETAPVVINPWTEIGDGGYYLTITPEGADRTIQGDFSGNGVIILNGADRVIIDGELNEGERNLHIINNTITGPLCAIWLKSASTALTGCNDVTIRNCVISGSDRTISTSMGIVLGGPTLSTAPTGYDHDNCLIENNKFKKVYYGGVNAYASSAGTYDNLQILNNEFGDDDLYESLGEFGINMYYCPGAIIDGNHIHNLGQYNVSNYCIGFQIGTGNGNSIITNNRIHTIWHTAYNYGGAHGITVTTSTGNDNILIANNAIYDLVTTHYNATNTAYNPFGIRIVGGTNISILHNSIHLYGYQQDGTGGYTNGTLSACIMVTASGVTGLDIRDNTLSNTLVGLEGSTPTCIYHAGTNSVFTNIDYNNYYIGELNPGYIGKLGATWYQTFEEWQAATLQDLSSLNVLPDYTADDNLAPNPSSPLVGAGTFIESLPFDILGNPRINPPTIGAYETDLGDDLPPPSLISPLNNSLGVPRLTQFEWNSVDGATSYYLQVATDAEFVNIIVGLSVPSTSHTLTTQLAETTQFYWRAKGEAEGVIGYWSQAWKFITEGTLAAPVLVSPYNGSEGLAPDNPLNWEAVFGANMYNVQISTNADFTEIIVDENIAGTVYIPSTLALQTDYWWRASATNGTNISPWSEIWAYSTGSIVTIGNGTTYNSTTGFPAPYGRYYNGARHQILITAEEYIAAGGLPGLITSLSFDIYAVNNCDAMLDFTIKMKPTTQTTLTAYEYDNWVTCFVAAPSYQPIVGWNTHTFDNPFEWDGASNILIETCFNNYPLGYTQNASHYYTITPVNTVGYYRSDSDENLCSTTSASVTYSANRPNMRFTMDISGLLPPQLAAPLNNSLDNPLTPFFDWNDVEGATSYSLQVATDASFENLVITQEGLLESSYQVPEAEELEESSLYFWRVNAMDGLGNISFWSLAWRFATTGPLPPVTLLTPVNIGTGVIVVPTFTWEALIGAENYELELSNNEDFSNILYSETGLINTNLTLPAEYALENNTTYYWRVRGYTGGNIGVWSDVWSFTTMTMVNIYSYLFFEQDETYEEFNDGLPTNISGDDQGANFDLPFTFIYAGSEFNQIRICSNGWVGLGSITHNSLGNDLASTTYIRILAPLWDDLVSNDITYRVEGVAPNQVYAVQFRNTYRLGASTDLVNFQVRLYEGSGQITFNYGSMTATYTDWTASTGINGIVGGNMDFISVTPGTPATLSSTTSNNSINAATVTTLANKKYTFLPMGDYATLLSPYNNTVGVPITPLFDWEDLEGYTSYQIQVSETSDFAAPVIDVSDLETSSYQVPEASALDESTLYHWRVMAYDVEGNPCFWSQVWRFATTGPLPPVTLTYPENYATGIPVLPTFTWQPLIGAGAYEFQIANDPEFANIIYSTTEILNTNLPLPVDYVLANNSVYYWRVRGYAGDNIGEWSDIWSFTTMTMVNIYSYLFVEEDEIYSEFTDGIPTNVSGDDQGANFDLPFTFIYAGSEFNQIRICSNGWVGLGDITHNGYTNDLASTTYIRLLAPLWDDLVSNDITYRVEGASPNQVYAVQFRNTYHLGSSSDLVNFQVRLYESSGFITFNYGSMTANYTGWSASTGINGLLGGSLDYISVTPGTPATASSTTSNNSINASIIPNLANKKYSFMPMGDYVALLSPLNNSLTESDVTLNWETLEGATAYHLMASDSPDFLTPIVDNDELTTTSYELEDLDPVTMHYWKVRALVGDEWTYWSVTWRFTTVGPLYEPELIAPANGSTGIPATIQFKWTDVLTASDYQVQVAADLGFNTLVLDQTTTETELTWGLDMNSNYFWRVRASNFAYTSPWSTIWSFSTGSFFVVGDGTMTNSTTSYPAPYGNWYWGAKHQILVLASEITAAGGLAGDLTSLSFNVAALNTAAALVNFEIRLKQTTATVLDNIWDTDNFISVYQNPSLTNTLGWNTHQFTTPFPWDGVSNVLIDICFNNSSYTSNQSTYYTTTTYNSVRYVRNDNATVCSAPGTPTLSMDRPNMMFSGGPTEPPPPAPSLALPEEGATNVILNPTLIWSSVQEAANYRVQLASDASFNNMIVNDLTPNTETLVGTTLEFSTQYWWRVRSVTALGTQGPWSSIWSFTTRPNVPWVVVEQTGSDANIVVQASSNPMIGDRPFMEGDAIGLFYERTPGDWQCAGYGLWSGINLAITVWGDDPNTSIKDGFEVFDPYIFKVWDGQALIEYNATATFIIGESYFTVNGFSIVGTLTVEVPEMQNILLLEGWNMISSFINPDDNDIVNLFAPIVANLNILKNGAGEMYIPAYNVNTIEQWNLFDGYFANMSQQTQITFAGYAVAPELTPVPLTAGWNLSPYLCNSSLNAAIALESLSTNLVIAKNNLGDVYVPSWGLNSIGDLNPGEGYYLNVTSNSNLTYPANGAGKASAGVLETPNPKHLIPSINRTGNSATLLIQIEGASDGCEVGVYDIKDNLIGSGYVQNSVVAANIWGDDIQTEGLEGAGNGEALTVKLYNPKTNNYTNLNLTSITEATSGLELDAVIYSENSVFMAKSSVNDIGNTIMNIRNTPNPVSGITYFEFTLVNDENAEIIIYNIRGEEVARIENNYFNAGTYKVSFDASDLITGAYNVVLRSGSNTVSTMMMVQK